MTETAPTAAKTRKPTLRLTFSEEQAREYYTYLGGKIGEMQSDLAIRDGRISEITAKVAAIQSQQDYIAEALRKNAAETQ